MDSGTAFWLYLERTERSISSQREEALSPEERALSIQRPQAFREAASTVCWTEIFRRPGKHNLKPPVSLSHTHTDTDRKEKSAFT